MDVLVTLKINDTDGNLLHSERQIFSDDVGYTLDEFIEIYGEHVEEYLLNLIEPNEDDCGEVILRFRYLALCDEFENDEDDEDDEEPDTDDENELITKHDDGVIVYDMSLTNERIISRFGRIREEYVKDGETST